MEKIDNDNYVIKTNMAKVTDNPIIIDNITSAYHYTSVDGLKSIVENQSIRFTDIEYMNDKEEVIDGLKIICDGNDPEHSVKNILNQFFECFHVFVFCMSRVKDALPLWNCYSKNNKNDLYVQ